MRTRLHFLNKLGEVKSDWAEPQTSIVIYDRKLIRAVPGFRAWIAKYPHAFAVTAGEKLKSFESFARESSRIHRAAGDRVNRKWTVIAVGGGSVGDFAGFFASVYKRGLNLVHIPTTWLAALDSSHGGKTALNLGGAKNQVGTFYPAAHTLLVQSILTPLPKRNVRDAIGELAKIALIDGRSWTRKLRCSRSEAMWLWELLPHAIESKLRIVRRDPYELRGDRQLLNLGHTFGHVLEGALGLSHGESVAQGLLFALDFSEAVSAVSAIEATRIRGWLGELGIKKTGHRIARTIAARLLKNDKKRALGNYVWFLVVKGFGKVERRQVDVEHILEVASVNGWLR